MKNNIFKTLLDSKHVNNYTKLLILLNNYDYFKEYYIPNRKIMNTLKINKNRTIILLHQLQEDKIIKLRYINRKRYFRFVEKFEEIEKPEVFNYDWLNEED